MLNAAAFAEVINSPVRSIAAKVELYEGSALLQTFNYTDALKSFTIERVGESKFFGFGICQRLNVKLIDPQRRINITTANNFEVAFGVEDAYFYPYPEFYITEVNRDENTGEISVTAYDALNKASEPTVANLSLAAPYTVGEFAEACAAHLGLPGGVVSNIEDNSFYTSYDNGANFDGAESLRDALNAVAEVTQSVYFVSAGNRLVFKRLDASGAPVLTIDKSKYFTLDSGTNRRLATIYSVTELGDDVYISTTQTGTTQYIRNNPFWELRDDVGELLEMALAAVGGLTINQFDCSWRGNPLLEIGDKIELTAKDGSAVAAYVLNETISYDGTLSGQIKWSFEDSESESSENPANLGEALKQTFARVDKANKEITLLAGEVSANGENISSLQLNTENIIASVEKTAETVDNINGAVADLTEKVSASVTAEDVRIEIKTELSNGVDKVETSTGYTLDEEGLRIEKSGSEMSTQITEDGMTVYKNDEAVLKANNNGVDAVNLHATTFLIVGNNSRFEDYEKDGEQRTGCFWIG